MSHRKAACFLGLFAAIWSGNVKAEDQLPTQLSLNDRVFIKTTDNYDPNYGLLRIGVIDEKKVLNYLPLNKDLRSHLPMKLNMRNFVVYVDHSAEGTEGKVDIPIIGSASAGKDQVVYAQMTDVAEVTARHDDSELSACKIWSLIPKGSVGANSTIIFTNHAVLTRVAHGVANKAKENVTAGIGTYFSVGVSAYQESNTDVTLPLIAVDGSQFLVKDPNNFCRGPALAAVVLKPFKKASDLTSDGRLTYGK